MSPADPIYKTPTWITAQGDQPDAIVREAADNCQHIFTLVGLLHCIQ
jgi:hypothetical protein